MAIVNKTFPKAYYHTLFLIIWKCIISGKDTKKMVRCTDIGLFYSSLGKDILQVVLYRNPKPENSLSDPDKKQE